MALQKYIKGYLILYIYIVLQKQVIKDLLMNVAVFEKVAYKYYRNNTVMPYFIMVFKNICIL